MKLKVTVSCCVCVFSFLLSFFPFFPFSVIGCCLFCIHTPCSTHSCMVLWKQAVLTFLSSFSTRHSRREVGRREEKATLLYNKTWAVLVCWFFSFLFLLFLLFRFSRNRSEHKENTERERERTKTNTEERQRHVTVCCVCELCLVCVCVLVCLLLSFVVS